jgi:hypothetical protein
MARELAILVTARNMASGVLKDVRGDIKGIQSEARRAASNTARNVGLIGAAAVGAIAVNVKAGIDSLAELERMQAQTNAVLKSTGSAAAGSISDIRARAEALEQLTTVDDKVIQNAQNLLLTFPQIEKKAFEPTLKAALDLNAALGGDDESLQQVLIQVGKAVNDPLTGLTALRRSGVSFTKQQQDQIKMMVKAGDVAGAQAIVLGELNSQFGGSAAAQADTYAGKMRLVQDAVEGAQMALATAFLPVLLKVGDKIETLLSDPKTLKNIEDFGGTLAAGLDDALAMIEKVPWGAVGSAFSIMGTGAKLLLDTFTSMPAWVQTAVLTGWGLNKLSGGALGGLVGQIIGAGVGKMRGTTPANPLFTKEVGVGGGFGGGGATGGGGSKGGGFGKGFGKGILSVLKFAGPLGVGLAAADQLGVFDAKKNVTAPLGKPGGEKAPGRGGTSSGSFTSPLAVRDEAALQHDRLMLTHARTQAAMQHRENTLAAAAVDADRAMLGSVSRQSGLLSAIAAKKTVFNPHVNVTANINNTVRLSTGQVLQKINSYRQSLNAGTSVDGFI